MQVRDYIKESCDHQNATHPIDYINMALAYAYTHHYYDISPTLRVTESLIREIGNLVSDAATEYRRFPAVFASGNIGSNADDIQRQITALIENQDALDPCEFYWAFESIHPFQDGNGRVGSLLFNYLNHTLHFPVHPPVNPQWT